MGRPPAGTLAVAEALDFFDRLLGLSSSSDSSSVLGFDFLLSQRATPSMRSSSSPGRLSIEGATATSARLQRTCTFVLTAAEATLAP